MRTALLLAVALVASSARGQFAFTDVTAGDLSATLVSWGVSWVDYDSDGDLDLFASRAGAGSAGNVLFRNDAGAFTRADAGALTNTGSPNSLGHTWGDIDDDGDLDVATVGGASRVYRNNGGTFEVITTGPVSPSADVRGWAAAWGDYDEDGLLDLVVAHPAGFLGAPAQENHLFRGIGGGALERVDGTPITDGLAPYTVGSWSDYDLDGDVDLFIGSGPANGTVAPDFLYENEGAGTFSRITTAPIATDPRDGQVMNWIDMDNDRDLDLCVTNYNNLPVHLYRNDNGAYVRITDSPIATDIPGSGLANAWGDVDNDGDLDLLVTGAGVDRFYANDGSGGFSSGGSLANGATSGATLGDFDHDGDLDLAVTSPPPSGGPVRLYRNDTASANHWLILDLVGTASNRSAIGATVWVRATIAGQGVWQHREVSAQNTFNGQHALAVHVGLGDAAVVDTLRIEWPSGGVDVATGLAADRRIRVEEGVTPSNAPPADQSGLRLGTPVPHPVRGPATISFTLPSPGPARLTLWDATGRSVAVLADGLWNAGEHVVRWDGSAARGPLAAGPYLLRLEGPGGGVSRFFLRQR
jgi:hypothetical protein